MIESLKRALKRLPPLGGLIAARDALVTERDALLNPNGCSPANARRCCNSA
jgi:hypothetical protein